MDWLNYHHLLYFWTVAHEGSVAAACKKLHLTQPTISGQLKLLEKAVGEPLFERQGRRLVLTNTGHLVLKYADEIFALGQELSAVLKRDRSPDRSLRLRVGVPNSMPKLIAFRLLEPAYRLKEKVRIVCREDTPSRLLAELVLHNLDVVLSDVPASAVIRVKAFSHLLGESGVAFFGTAKRKALQKGFPQSLQGKPVLLPAQDTALRRSIDGWFRAHEIEPEVVGEFDDTALQKVFAQADFGIVPAPVANRDEIERQYGLTPIGRADGVVERFYAVTVERRITHPAVVAISEQMQREPLGD